MFHHDLAATARRHADKPAIRFGDQTINYGSLVARGSAAATWLSGAGVKAGDRIGWLAHNDPLTVDLLYGASAIGAALVPLNTRLTAQEQQVRLERAGVSHVICQRGFAEALEPVVPETAGFTVVEPGATLGGEGSTVGAGPAADTGGAVDSRDPDDVPLLIVFTSGTTGAPKGVVHTQATHAATMQLGRDASALTSADVTLGFLPLFHVGGLNIQVLPTLLAGGTVILHDSFDPGQVLADIERFRVTTAVFVPATIGATIAHPAWETTDLSSLRGVMTGSSVIPPELLAAFHRRGVPAGQVYGSTETGPTVVVLNFDDAVSHVGSAGRACAGCKARVIADELQVRGPNLFTEYLDDPATTAAAMENGWYRTGDRARIDPDGLVWVEGRVDDMIISGGENIDPTEVEAVLGTMPGIADIAIVGAPDDRWGEVPVAVVVADPAHPTPTLKQLRDVGQGSLARFKLPTAIELTAELPRTALGKVKRFELRRMLRLH